MVPKSMAEGDAKTTAADAGVNFETKAFPPPITIEFDLVWTAPGLGTTGNVVAEAVKPVR